MPMRDYFPLDKIEIPEAQEKIMDIMCEAWEECNESECKGCTDRKSHFMSIRECLSLKESRMLVDAGYVKVVRCKDCKHRHSSEFCECRPEDAYCSDGERKEVTP